MLLSSDAERRLAIIYSFPIREMHILYSSFSLYMYIYSGGSVQMSSLFLGN